jgi:hypothetical protein
MPLPQLALLGPGGLLSKCPESGELRKSDRIRFAPAAYSPLLVKKCVFLNQSRGKLEASLGELDSAKDFSPKKAKKSFAEPKTRA